MNNSIEDVLNLARPEILALQAYRSARSDVHVGAKIWLDANENPWDLSNKQQYNRYPEPQPSELRTRLANLYGVTTAQLLITRGSDEGIDILMRTFCTAHRDEILICPPTYGMYKVAASLQGAGVIEVPLVKGHDFDLDIQAIVNISSQKIKLIFLCCPNNPTGNSFRLTDILFLCNTLCKNSLLVIDEAYIEFSQEKSVIQHLQTYPNLVILRTLSKAFGLAGLRCGALIAHPLIIDLLKKVIAPYPVAKPITDIVCQKLQCDSLPIIKRQIKRLCNQRNILFNFLQNLSFVKNVWPSETNFLLFEVDDLHSVMAACQKHGIVLRDRSNEYNLKNCIRISIGTMQENKLLMEVLKHV